MGSSDVTGLEMEAAGNKTTLGVSTEIAQQVGARLRQARESIGRTTSALSAKIKVREHYLVAIEGGQWNELPPGLNGRGLVRIYARELSVSVPELDQAANQTVMPAEHDAQAPYQVGGVRKESPVDKEFSLIRVVTEKPVSPQSSARSAELSVKTQSAFSGPRMSRHSESETYPKAQRTVGQATLPYRGLDVSPDEEPLDVVTPDVAAILGINLDSMDIQSGATNPASAQSSHSKSFISSVKIASDEAVIAPIDEGFLGRNANSNSEPEKFSTVAATVNDTAKQHFEVPSAMIALENSLANEKESAEALSATESTAALTPVVSDTPQIQNTEHHSPRKGKKHSRHHHKTDVREQSDTQSVLEAKENSQTIAVEQTAVQDEVTQAIQTAADSNSVGSNAAEQYLSKRNETAPSEDGISVSTKSAQMSKGIRVAAVLLAACAVAMIGGRYLMGDKAPTHETTGETAAVSDSTSQDSDKPATQDAAPEGSDAAETLQTNTSADSSQAALTAGGEVQTASASVSSQEAQQATDIPAPPAAQAATSETAENTDLQSTTAATQNKSEIEDKPVTKSAGTGRATALLMVSESTEIQVTADGKRIYSGKQGAGSVEIKFTKRAEIIVNDGSKVRLKYSGWEHGTLGQAGRKRRIVLNAEAFPSSGQ